MGKLTSDPRIDPRIKAAFGDETIGSTANVADRAELLAQEHSQEGRAMVAQLRAMMEPMGSEEVASSAGLEVRTETFVSSPNGNEVKLLLTRPAGSEPLPCVLYFHGGGMALLSAFDGNYRAWARLIAAEGVAVAMVDFRNAIHPSSAEEVAPYPAGLDDCVASFKWLHANAAQLGIEPARIIVAGDSGGGNLSLATAMRLLRDGAIGQLAGIWALCPYIAGQWPSADYPSSTDNNGIMLDLHNNRAAIGYGIEAFAARDPLAWPTFATEDDVRGLPATVISVNECDPLRDEGLSFYRLLLRSGVAARAVEIKGTTHAIEVFPAICPEISRYTAANIARFCKQSHALG